jgi:hypothetical protein
LLLAHAQIVTALTAASLDGALPLASLETSLFTALAREGVRIETLARVSFDGRDERTDPPGHVFGFETFEGLKGAVTTRESDDLAVERAGRATFEAVRAMSEALMPDNPNGAYSLRQDFIEQSTHGGAENRQVGEYVFRALALLHALDYVWSDLARVGGAKGWMPREAYTLSEGTAPKTERDRMIRFPVLLGVVMNQSAAEAILMVESLGYRWNGMLRRFEMDADKPKLGLTRPTLFLTRDFDEMG